MSRVGQENIVCKRIRGVLRNSTVSQFRVYRYAVMSRACRSSRFMSGMALLGTTAWGWRSHSIMFSGVLRSTPAMVTRTPI